MSEHFVKYINIKRYKCFRDFSAEGFKRVNLISGRNNVGKTALLEALFLNVHSENVQAVIQGLYVVDIFRNRVDGLPVADMPKNMENISEKVEFATNINTILYGSDDSEILKQYTISVNGHDTTVPASSLKEVITASPQIRMRACYIGSIGDSQKNIISSFAAIQKKDRESDVHKVLQNFDDSIENVKVIGDTVQCKVVEADGTFSYRNISEFGDGLRHYISIIADLFVSENRCLFIDELDSGIHYSSLGQLWELILTLSKELNVQVFATTHSRECIESYCRVAEKLQEKDISFITLVRNKEREVKAIVRDYEVFTDSIHDDREVRGW